MGWVGEDVAEDFQSSGVAEGQGQALGDLFDLGVCTLGEFGGDFVPVFGHGDGTLTLEGVANAFEQVELEIRIIDLIEKFDEGVEA